MLVSASFDRGGVERSKGASGCLPSRLTSSDRERPDFPTCICGPTRVEGPSPEVYAPADRR